MRTAFIEGGFMMWFIAFAGLLTLAFAALTVRALMQGESRSGATPNLDAVLFWGGFALAAGILGTVVGLYQMATVIEVAGQVPTSLAWGGFRVTLLPTQWGLAIFLLALLLWFGLSWAIRRQANIVAAAGS